MAIRSLALRDLALIQQRLLLLAEAVDRAIISAMWSLAHPDMDAARQVIEGNVSIEGLRAMFEEEAIQLIAHQQRMVGDVRTISTMIQIAAELERIGDYAQGIATTGLRIRDTPLQELPPVLNQMAQQAREMLQQAMRAVVTREATTAKRLHQMDDTVDHLYQHTFHELLATMRAHPEQSARATYLLWIAHNLERIADRSVKIAEGAAFIATGVRSSDKGHRDVATVTTVTPGLGASRA